MDCLDSSVSMAIESRNYQQEILEKAKNENVIIYLPTGAGKTYIVTLLIRDIGYSLEHGRRTFFLVNTVPLVEQQANALSVHLPYKIGRFTGDMNVDTWREERWQKELADFQVVVLTTQIFLNIIQHNFYRLEDVNLLVFDECHNAYSDHAMRQLARLFQDVTEDLRPRIVGLTATLLNKNVNVDKIESEIRDLEITLNSKIITSSDPKSVESFLANPDESFIMYSEVECEGLKEYIKEINEAILMCDNFRSFYDEKIVADISREEEICIEKIKGRLKDIINILEDFKIQLKTFGVFGVLKMANVFFLSLHQEALIELDDNVAYSIFAVLSHLYLSYIKIEAITKDLSFENLMHDFASSKISQLLKVLAEISNKITDQDNTIIFVKRRSTARIMYLLLVEVCQLPPYRKLRPTFLLGQNRKIFNTPNLHPGVKQFKYIMNAFRNGEYNLMISTDILEEGIDIPDCSHVIKFEEVLNYRSYVQSKGRCRKKGGRFYVFTEEKNHMSLVKKLLQFKDIEIRLKNILYKSNRVSPTEEEINENLFNEIIPPFYVDPNKKSACLTAINSMNLLYSYCNSLSNDPFTILEPYWFKTKRIESPNQITFVSKLEMPVESGYVVPIDGDPMCTKKLSKFSTSYKVCKMLLNDGELDKNLYPISRKVAADESTVNFYPNEHCDKHISTIIQIDEKRYVIPKTPSDFLKTPLINDDNSLICYVHLIRFSCKTPDEHLSSIFENNNKFGFITASQLPKICKFSLYIYDSELITHIQTNVKKISISTSELESIKYFNIFLFRDIMHCFKPFFLFSRDDQSMGLFIVPLDENLQLHWDIIHKFRKQVEVKELSYMQRKNMVITKELYNNSIIIPWYRPLILPSIALSVCEDLTPFSEFPNSDYKNYNDYYSDKYDLTVYNKTQPLILAKNIPKCDNFLLVRKSKKNKFEQNSVLHLVPEFCTRQEFPGDLWVKAILLPSVLYRMDSLLKSECILQKICKYTGFLPDSFKQIKYQNMLEKLYRDEIVSKEMDTEKYNIIMNNLLKTLNATNNIYDSFMSNNYNSSGFSIPADLDYSALPTFFDIFYFCGFYFPLETIKNDSDKVKKNSIIKTIDDENNYKVKPINLLNKTVLSDGPDQLELLQALTSTDANDIFSFERLETLGDSLLKFIVSIYLFNKFESFQEGMLVTIKGKMIGNENLFYNGCSKHIHEYMNVSSFSPTTNWHPPSFNSIQLLKDINRNKQLYLPLDYILKFEVPLEEQVSGVLSENTMEHFQLMLSKFATESEKSCTQFFDDQLIYKKRVSDCVEAIIGVFLKCKGIYGGIKLIKYFDIIPNDYTANNLLKDKVKTAFLNESSADVRKHIRNVDTLEQQIGYVFKDKSFLLQALSHLSYMSNRMTKSYQRLEFLGDAILDFLITSYIFENCENFTPGEITDLRSALVNNVFFAALTVRNNLHKYILYNNLHVYRLIDSFVQMQTRNNHDINESVLYLITEEDCQIVEYIEAPKILGDIWESLAAAIFLDSNYSLQTVWEVFYKLMRNEIEEFMKNIPKNPLRLLYEMSHTLSPKFISFKEVEIGKMACCLQITVQGTIHNIYGFANNKARAKRAAAKLALRHYNRIANK